MSAETTLVSWVRAPAASATGVRELLLLIGKPARFRQARELRLLSVELLQERTAIVETVDVEPLGRPQAVHAEVGGVRIARDLPGVVAWAQKARVLSRPDQRALHEERRQVDAGRQAVVAWPQMIERRGIAGPIVARRHLVEERPRLRMPGQDVMSGHEVVVFPMRQRPHHRVLVGPRRQPRQMLADHEPGNARGNGPKFAANLRRRIRLRVEHIEMARRAGEKNEDHRLRRPRGRRGALRRHGPLSQQRRQAHPEQARVADLQHLATRDADAVLMTRRRCHGDSPGRRVG